MLFKRFEYSKITLAAMQLSRCNVQWEIRVKLVDPSHLMNVQTLGWVGNAVNKMYDARNLLTKTIVARPIETALHGDAAKTIFAERGPASGPCREWPRRAMTASSAWL